MLFERHLIVVRGGGDLGTGAVARLHRAGFPVVVLELQAPLAIRRRVAVASAVTDGAVRVEDLDAMRVDDVAAAVAVAAAGRIPVVPGAGLPPLPATVAALVDARLAKENLDTARDQAPTVVGLGPGFVAGVDCHAVVETKRGHHLGRVIWDGAAAADTGMPGEVGGESATRVVRAPGAGSVAWEVAIGDTVRRGAVLGRVGDTVVTATLDGVVRGLIADGFRAAPGLKIADVDPRGDRTACFEISDKALAVGGGVLEAVLSRLASS